MICKIYQFERLPSQELNDIESAIWVAKWYLEDYCDAKYDFIYGLLIESFYEMYADGETNYDEPDYPDFAKYFGKKLNAWKDGYIKDEDEINEHLYLKCCKIIYNELVRLKDELSSIDGMIDKLKKIGCEVSHEIGTRRCISVEFHKEQIGTSIREANKSNETIDDLINIYNLNVDKINSFNIKQKQLQHKQEFDTMLAEHIFEQKQILIAKSEERQHAKQLYQEQIKSGLMRDFILIHTIYEGENTEMVIHKDDIVSIKRNVNPDYIDIVLNNDTIISVDAEYFNIILRLRRFI